MKSVALRCTLLAVLVSLVFSDSPAAADGFHNAALATKSLEDWMADVRRTVPDIASKMNSSEMRSGQNLADLRSRVAETRSRRSSTAPGQRGSIETQYSPEQQALLARKGNDCLDILAYMDPKNIFPSEFPNFQLSKIPAYRVAAKQLLRAMGPMGTEMVAGRTCDELMGQSRGPSDCTPSSEYYNDLVEVLGAGFDAGDLSADEIEALVEAAQGEKSPALEELVRKVTGRISLENCSLTTLADLLANADDVMWKRRLETAMRQRVKDARFRELLEALASVDDGSMRRRIDSELRRRKPTYGELKDDISGIWQLTRSDDRRVATAARSQIVDAFQRAPVSQCLYWIGQGDAELGNLIWEQVDGRISRADGERRAEYAKVAGAVLGHDGFNLASRTAAIDLLARLKDRRFAMLVVEQLLELPRGLWPKAGQFLREATGEDFGPRSGDGMGEVLDAQKKWKAWSQKQEDGR